LKKVAFTRTNIPYAQSIIKKAREQMESDGFTTVIADAAVAPRATDFTAFLAECKAKGVEIIVNCFLLDEGVNFTKQFAAEGLNKKIAYIGSLAAALIDEFSARVGNATAAWSTSLTAATGPVDMTGDGAAPAFAKKFKEKYNISPYWQAYITYDAIRVVKDVAEKTKGLDAAKILALIESPDYEFKGLSLLKWKKENHDLYHGVVNGKHYADHPWFQFFPDGTRYCVYPNDWKQKEFLMPGQEPQ